MDRALVHARRGGVGFRGKVLGEEEDSHEKGSAVSGSGGYDNRRGARGQGRRRRTEGFSPYRLLPVLPVRPPV